MTTCRVQLYNTNNMNRTVTVLLIVVSLVGVNSGNLCSSSKECKCEEAADRISVNCGMVDDLSVLRNVFQKELHGRPLRSVKVMKCSAKNLSSDLFANTSIQSISLFCPLETVEEMSFSYVDSLTWLDIAYSKFPEIPPGVQNLPELRTLLIRNGYLEKFDLEFASMPLLSQITLTNNQIETISENAFSNNPNLQILHLSHNKISVIHVGTLINCKNLHTVHLEENRIRKITGVFMTEFIKDINLRKNELVSLNGAFKSYMEVENLDFGQNPNIALLSDYTFSSNIRYLKSLHLDRCKLTEVPTRLLKPLVDLVTVDLSFNQLTIIPENFFHNLFNLREIYLQGNKIQTMSNVFYNNKYLEDVFLYKNEISSLQGVFDNLSSVQKIHLGGNNIQVIHQDDFSSCTKLDSLNLRDNSIEYLEKGAFSRLAKLQNLTLEKNHIRSLNGSIQNLPDLQQLDVRSNFLTVIDENELYNLPSLKYIKLLNNKLCNINGAFRNLPNLVSLQLMKNKLNILSRRTFPPEIKLTELTLTGNKWICDCRLSWLRDLMVNRNISSRSPVLGCSTPNRISGKLLHKLKPEDLLMWPDDCPDPCKCTCVSEDTDFHIKVDCTGRGLSKVPIKFPNRTGELNLQSNMLANPLKFDSSSLTRLKLLNLERNFIEKLDFTLPENVTILKLAANNLTRFFESDPPESIRNWTLSENPWKCDCETLPFKSWLLSQGNNVLDVNSTRCSADAEDRNLRSQVIVFLLDSQLCPTPVSTYILISVAVLLFLVACTSSRLLYSKYHYHMKVWLYSRGLTLLKKAEIQDIGKLHDVYVSVADDDLHFVEKYLIPELEEKQPYYSLYIPSRNMLAGDIEISKQIEEVNNSKRIIVLLSQHYIEDQKCMKVFKFAFASSLEEKFYRLILIVIGDLPPLSEVDQQILRTALESTKCLRLEQKLFWEMLKFALPRKDGRERKSGSYLLHDIPALQM